MDTYEKKYKEIVGQIKKAYLYAQTDSTKAVLEEIIPELAESEDEKIKKRITLCLEECVHSDVIRDYEKDECIAWLEKQKGNIGGISANWSEEDKGIIEEVVSYLINYSNIVESKEDADRIEYLIDKIQDICPHQKQEWSEEDEQHIDSLLKRLDALCRNKFERTRFAISEDRNWLKSLRPHNLWKPSDEQMSLLQAIINEPNNAASESCQIVLREVLEQLKKLKEE